MPVILSFRLHTEKNCRCTNIASKKKRHGEENAVDTNTKAPSKKEKHSKTRKFWPGNRGLEKCKTDREETYKCCKYQRICLQNLQDKKIMSRKTSRQLCTMCLVVVVVVVVVVVRAAWFFDGTLFWHMSFENHTMGVVFEKQKPSELSAIKCLFRLSISD